jgi:nitrite reductase/ring-hydroxylating ferredoxin subunit
MPRFVTVAKADSIQPGQMIKVEIDNLPVAVANVAADLPRVRRRVHPRRLLAAEGELAKTVDVSAHFAEFDIRNGAVLAPPATVPIKVYPFAFRVTTCKWNSDADDAIVGASLTGSSAAATLREEGFDGRVLLIGAERSLRTIVRPLQELSARRDAVREDPAAAG